MIVIVARNNLHLTKQAVKSALAQDVPCDVLLIDNASTDGTAKWAATKPIARVTYPEQKSLSACWNTGIAFAWQKRDRECLVLNNDVEIRPDTYRILAIHDEYPFVTCVSVRERERAFAIRTSNEVYGVRPHPDFSCFMIRREVTNRVGWFDESYYPAFYEDNSYHVRMHRAGIEAVCIDLPFLHHGSQTIKSADLGEQERIKRGADRNRERFRLTYGCLPGTPEYEALFR